VFVLLIVLFLVCFVRMSHSLFLEVECASNMILQYVFVQDLLQAGHFVLRPDLPYVLPLQIWWAQCGNAQSLTALSQPGMMGGVRVDMGTVMDLSDLRAVDVRAHPENFTVFCRLASVQTRKQGEFHPITFMGCMEIKDNNRPCKRKVSTDGWCSGCNKAVRSAPRLHLRCQFSDHADNAWLTVFHEPSLAIVNMTADEARSH
jgi:hypothetical protein